MKVLVHVWDLVVKIGHGEIVVTHAAHGGPTIVEYVAPEVLFVLSRLLQMLPSLLFAKEICHEAFEHARRQIVDRRDHVVVGRERTLLLSLVLSLRWLKM